MLKILVYTDGKPAANQALWYAVGLKRILSAELAVITIRSQSPPVENPPPISVECPFKGVLDLPPGIRTLVQAAGTLLESGLLQHLESIQIRYGTNGYAFACPALDGLQVLFYEKYGNFIEVLNYEVAEHHYDLLIISIPRRNRLGRFVPGDTARRLVLDLHTSLLVVRGGTPEDRFLVCADGSPSARRIFPLLQEFLPAVKDPVGLIWVRKPDAEAGAIQPIREELERVGAWIQAHGRRFQLLAEENEEPVNTVLKLAGANATIVMGVSLRHDVYRRMRGSFPLQIIRKTESSVLLAKRSQEADLNAVGADADRAERSETL